MNYCRLRRLNSIPTNGRQIPPWFALPRRRAYDSRAHRQVTGSLKRTSVRASTNNEALSSSYEGKVDLWTRYLSQTCGRFPCQARRVKALSSARKTSTHPPALSPPRSSQRRETWTHMFRVSDLSL
ncbi:hypothetical protein ARMSODRAFT_61893 [Armillaria solidipes]|uniref:Uncharacterized protein n=1 Tax=Armillaria solidipes TaxID=1076256 RepID=A0A2H3C701_9AGAR|nr:hypothetical protein ARMSODRAFT_61893 [Armillaria solidipes]